MARRTKLTPPVDTKVRASEVTITRTNPATMWTLLQAVDLLAQGYAVESVSARTGHDAVKLAQAARERRIEVRRGGGVGRRK